MSDPEPTALPLLSPKPVLMSDEMMVKVCAFVSLTYLALVLYFLSAIHSWGFFSELPIKATRDLHGHIAGLFGTPVCAVAFLVLFWLMRQWDQRRDKKEGLWNRFAVPFQGEIPSTDPVGRAYRGLYFVLIFGLGAYVQGDLLKSFLQGSVHLDWPSRMVPEPVESTSTGATSHVVGTFKVEGSSTAWDLVTKDSTAEQDCRPFKPSKEQQAADPQVVEFAGSHCGIVIDQPMKHFTHRFAGLFSNDYHFEQKNGLTYFPGYQPYAYLLLTICMALAWLWFTLPWLLAIFPANAASRKNEQGQAR